MDNRLILNTKLYMPSARQNQVIREALNKRLDEGRQKGHKIVMVSAPAGYGKTTLISEWIRRTGCSSCCCWISLDEYDNDSVRFINYLITAIRKINHAFGAVVEDLMLAPKLPGAEIIASYIIKELEEVEEPFFLVLDDYHAIKNRYIHDLVQKLLDNTVSNMIAIILTRQDPPLTLSKWRAKDSMIELKAWDLKFEEEEIKEFFRSSFSMNFDADMLKIVEQRTEGWAAGLQLNGLYLKSMERAQSRSVVEEFKGSNGYIIDYLINEILEKQEDKIRSFLAKTSTLKRFCGELCEAVTGLEGCKSIIELLERDNLFIIPLDCSGTWYRYHHLFSEFLQTGLDEQQKAEVNRKASNWFREQGFVEEALEYALEARDGEAAESLVMQEAVEFFRRGEVKTLLSWINAVAAIKEKRDAMLEVYRAWCLLLAGAFNEAYGVVEGLRKIDEIPNKPFILGVIQLQLCWYSREDIDRAITLAEEAVINLKDGDELFYYGAMLALGHVKAWKGHITEAADVIAKAYTGARGKGYHFLEFGSLVYLAICLNYAGKRREALLLCEEALEHHTDPKGMLRSIAKMVYLPVGMLLYDNNRLNEARSYLQDSIAYSMEVEYAPIIGPAEWFYVHLLYALDEKEKALETVYKLKKQAKKYNFPGTAIFFEALEIELHLREKNTEMVNKWVNGIRDILQEVQDSDNLYVYYTYLRAIILQGKLCEAEEMLQTKEKLLRENGRYRDLITLLLLSALVKKRTGKETEALDCVKDALKIAAPEGYIRHFLDEDDEILELVRKVRDVAPAFVDQLVEKDVTIDNKPANLLKNRELEILGLIAAGLTNDQISNKLYITTGTVKWHIKNIYGKLAVNRRTQAVERAKQLKIIT